MGIGNVLAELFVKIGADTAGLTKGLSEAEKAANIAATNFSKHTKKMGIAMTAVGGAIVAVGALSLKTYSSMGDEIEKMSIKTGLSTESLSEWRHMAELGGTSLDAVSRSIKAMANALEPNAQGTIECADALGKLGITLDDLKGKSPEEIFDILTQAVANVENPLQRSALAMDIFGKSGTDLLPILDQGTEGMAAQRQEAHDLGIVFDQEAATKASNFQDAIEKLQASFTGLKMAIADKLIPVLQPLIDSITNIVQKVTDWTKKHPKLTKVILIVVGAIGGLMLILGPLLLILPGLIALLPLLGAAFSVCLGPVGLIAVAIAATITALVILVRRIRTAKSDAVKEFEGLANKAEAAFKSIAWNAKVMTEDLRKSLVDSIDPMFDDIISKLESRKGDFIAAFVAMYSGAITQTKEELAASVTRITEFFDIEIESVKAGKARIQEIYEIAAEEHRKTTEEENAEILQIWRSAYSEGLSIATKGAESQEDVWNKLATAGENITASMYAGMLLSSQKATVAVIGDAETKYEKLSSLAQENVGILTGYTQQMADEDIASARRETDESIRIYKEHNVKLKEELDKRTGIWIEFLAGLKMIFQDWKWWDWLALVFPPAKIPSLTASAPTPMQRGGIVTRPTVSLIGESGPEAIIPLNRGLAINREIHIHIGNFMGDELSLRTFTRKLQDIMREEDRRNMFGGSVNLGYGYGRSSI